MKVGTDGVLLGAWAPLPLSGRVLDIGTGSGLIALMMAQRGSQLHVTGIEVDADAVQQARENVVASPFADRVVILHCSLQELASDDQFIGHYDALVCNPPFFAESLLPPDHQRSLARHTNTLPFSELVSSAAKLLRRGGSFSVILPTTCCDEFRQLCFASGLFLSCSCSVRTTAVKPPKRSMMTFLKDEHEEMTFTDLILMENGVRSDAYSRLTSDFYLY